MRKLRFVSLILFMVLVAVLMTGCDSAPSQSEIDTNKTIEIASELAQNQSTPTDIEYSLERYNLIRRAYWVNGQREKAVNLVCPVQKPLGYIILFAPNGGVVGRFVVDGKVSSLNSFLTPDSEYYERAMGDSSRNADNRWLADVDGSYGVNVDGIFFFTPLGNYIEWNGTYLYSDIPFEISDPIVKYQEAKQ